jgi:predicted dehydrogenase
MEHPLLIDMANHHFDTIRCVLGQEPVGVEAIGWNPGWSRFQGIASAVVVFDYASGLRLVYDGSWHTIDVDMTSNACDWRIECEHGVIACKQEVVYEGKQGNSPTGTTGIPLQPSEMLVMPVQHQAYLLHEFIHAISDSKPPETTGRDNLNTMKMVFGAVEAVNTGKYIKLKDFKQ